MTSQPKKQTLQTLQAWCQHGRKQELQRDPTENEPVITMNYEE
jgi:hypothetical protein